MRNRSVRAPVITAALCWFDEDPADLRKFVLSLEGAVDRLIAADGGYARYPGATRRSSKDESAAIRDACAEIGLPVTVHIPDRIWAGQVEKRTFLINEAVPGSDWVFTLDADHILQGVREAFRQEMAHVRAHRVDLDFFTTVNPYLPLAATSSTDWHSEKAGKMMKSGLLLKAMPEMRYERYHWWITGLENRQRIWIYGGDKSRPHGRAHELKAPFFVEHRCHFRRERNILANRVFCEDRVTIVKKTGQEDEVAA